MTGDDREGLIARIRQVRRIAVVRDQPKADAPVSDSERLQALETRVAHLEQQLEGFQDSVHRESERHDKLIAQLQSQLEPGALGAAMADDARDRGL
jgi:Tfp pilus assembly protein FimV